MQLRETITGVPCIPALSVSLPSSSFTVSWLLQNQPEISSLCFEIWLSRRILGTPWASQSGKPTGRPMGLRFRVYGFLLKAWE